MSDSLRTRRAALARVHSDALVELLSAAERLRDERRDAEAAAAAALGHAEATLAAARIGAADTATERDRLREALAALEAAIARDDERLDANRRATADLAARRAASEREGRDFSGEETRTAKELSELAARLERAVAEARARSLAREDADRRASEAAAALSRLERELETAREEALRATGERVASRNARHDLELSAERIAAGIAGLDESLAKLARQLSERRSDLESAEREEKALAESAAGSAETVRRLAEEVASLVRAASEMESAREEARASLAAFEERAAALSELLRAREEALDALRRALAGAGLEGRGTLAEHLRPAAGWERALDVALGGDLDALVARGDWRSAAAAARQLPSPRVLRADWGHPPDASPVIPGTLGGWEVALSNFDALKPAERSALPRVAFVDSLEVALPLVDRYPDATFVTRDGDVVRGPMLRFAGAPARTGGKFALERERTEIAERSEAARSAIASIEAARTNLASTRERRERELAEAREHDGRAQSELSAFSARVEERRESAGRLAREIEAASTEREVLAEQAAALEARRRLVEEEERRWEALEIEWRERAEALAGSAPEARAAATAAAEDLAHRRTEAEVAAERRRSLESAMAALEDSQRLFQRRAREANEEIERIALRALELAREEEETRSRREASVVARDGKASELEQAARSAEEAAQHATAAEEAARSARTVLDAAREGRFEAEVSATRAASDLEHLVSQARQEFGTEPGELEPPEDRSEEGLQKLETEAAELAASLERLGPVNLLAWEEHRAESERLTFLTTQRDDLVRSVAELQDSIRKINATSAERFSEAFTAINANFTEMFTRLFRGGTAEMRLLDESDPLESGVEIIAQPPGKRNQSILLLSGGEKALTAISLLMAIFRYRPSPFCILDEVDAPLDEANIDRFTRLLREMTEETQFIAITHNKRTMETADAMYGVTMEEPGCSKVVSVRFD